MMEVKFLEEEVVIESSGKKKTESKENLLSSLEHDIASKGFIVNNQIIRQDIGDYIYYRFFYFDGILSKNIQMQIAKTDSSSIIIMDRLCIALEMKRAKPELIFDEHHKNRNLK